MADTNASGSIRFQGQTDLGLVRTGNEDAFGLLIGNSIILIGNSIESLPVAGIMPEKLAGGIVAVKVKFPLAGFYGEAVSWL